MTNESLNLTPDEEALVRRGRESRKAAGEIAAHLQAFNEAKERLLRLLMTHSGRLLYLPSIEVEPVVLDGLGEDLATHLGVLELRLATRGEELDPV